jgi:alpha-glucoside transport system substrate-binding protein
MFISKKKLLATAGIAATTLVASLVTVAAPAAAAVDCAPYEKYGKHTGKTVEFNTSILDPEKSLFEKVWKDFETCTGITINFTGTNQFEAQLPVRVAGGTAPDLAVFPQPGLLAKMVETGKVVAAPASVVANVDKYWTKGYKDLGSVGGKFYAAPLGSSLKSLVWYSPKQFAKNGYAVPTTWTQLTTLANRMAAKKQTAFCGGIGSGGATGWPATDWVEQMVLREHGAQVYADWTTNKVKFSDPRIQSAMKKVAGWMQNPKWVGNVKKIATTTFQDAGQGIPTGKCMMLQQASFYAGQFPEKNIIAADGDVYAFYLPGTNPKVKTPILTAGEFIGAFSARAEVAAVQAYLSSAEFATAKVAEGGWATANNGVPLFKYKDPIQRLSAQYLSNKNATAVFDGSDIMPASIGAGKMWTEFTAWFAEGKSIAAVTKALDAAWPKS